MTKDEDVNDEFLGELRGVVGNLDNNNPKNDRSHFTEQNMEIPPNAHKVREMNTAPGFGRSEFHTDPVSQNAVAVPAANHPEELMKLDELCADVMKMHRDEGITQVQETGDMEAEYEFAWTGM